MLAALLVLFVVFRNPLADLVSGARLQTWTTVFVSVLVQAVPFLVFGFGLLHGLGLSTRLQALGPPDDGQLARIIGFNIGVEGGQLLAIGGFYVLGSLLRRMPRGRAGRGWRTAAWPRPG